MGKQIYIYEVDAGLLSRHVPGLLDAREELKEIRGKASEFPASLTVEEYDLLLDFIYEHVLSQDRFSDELEELGFKNTEVVQPSYAAMVFMELLRELLPRTVDHHDCNLYRLSKAELLLFTEVLMLYQELFEAYEDPGTARIFDLPAAIREQFTNTGEALLKREIKYREALREAYSGKWFPHYFHFFMGIDPQSMRNTILKGTGDVYLVNDSY